MASFGTDGIEGNIAEAAAEGLEDPGIAGKDGPQGALETDVGFDGW
jgi:hypothetical protein